MKQKNNIPLPSIFPVTCHTNFVGKNSTFVAIKGQKDNGILYIKKALEKGATQIIVENGINIPKNIKNEIKKKKATITFVENTRLTLAQLSAKATNHAHEELHIIGITGTKGKTSTAFILEHLLRNSGYNTALISTVYNKIKNQIFASQLTTDQPDYLHQFLKLCFEQKVIYVIMEVAAQALSLHRVAGIVFDVVVFTNFGQEHGEFYHTINDYFQAKCKIFDQIKHHAPLFINADDDWCKKFLLQKKNIIPFSIKNKNLQQFDCPILFGAFNCYNLLAAVSVANHLGISINECKKNITHFPGVPGRLELHTLQKGTRCFIDYAHNPSSFKAVLSTLKQMTDHFIVVFGAGGERDQAKRPIMGKIVANFADIIIVTSDNPRSEDPQAIIAYIISEIDAKKRNNIITEPDRKKAITVACKLAKSSSIVAILGKGPDEYQIIGNRKIRFSEKEILQAFSS